MQTCRINASARSFISRVGLARDRMKRPIRPPIHKCALGLDSHSAEESITSSCVVLLITCIASNSRKKTVPTSQPAWRRSLSRSFSRTQKLFSPDRRTDALPFVRVKCVCNICARSFSSLKREGCFNPRVGLFYDVIYPSALHWTISNLISAWSRVNCRESSDFIVL
jgi:hypothetical protein